MFFIILFALIPCCYFGNQFENLLVPMSLKMHNFCVQGIPLSIQHHVFLESLICGSPLPKDEIQEAFRNSHLIHLIIISAGHFIWIEKLLQHLKTAKLFQTGLFLSYGLITLLQPPAIRFLFQQLTTKICSWTSCHLKTHHSILLCSLICLLFFPHWVNSMSFLLSWGCSLSLQLSTFFTDQNQNPVRQILSRHFYFLLFLSPWMIALCNWHPLQIVSQILLAPLILGLLFPIGILSLFIHFLQPLFDHLFDFLLIVLKSFQHFQPQEIDPPKPHILFFWIYLLGLHFTLHFLEIHKKRQLP